MQHNACDDTIPKAEMHAYQSALTQCADFILRSMCKKVGMEDLSTYKVSKRKRTDALIRM